MGVENGANKKYTELTWKPVKGYEGVYEVSNNGNVRRCNGKMLKPKVEKSGYVRFHLSKNNVAKSVSAHRIVAVAFIPNPNNYKTVNHKDENKENNDVSNLEWCDMHYQNTYGKGAVNRNNFKKKSIVQMDIHDRPIRVWNSIKEAADGLGLLSTSICAVCKGRKYKTTGGFKFKYVGEVERK